MRNPHIFFDDKSIKCTECNTEELLPESGQPQNFKIWGSGDLNQPQSETKYWVVECFTCEKSTGKAQEKPYLYY